MTQNIKFTKEQKKILKMKVEDIPVGIRLTRCFKELGFKTVENALPYTLDELYLKHTDLGRVTLAGWEEFLEDHGLKPGIKV